MSDYDIKTNNSIDKKLPKKDIYTNVFNQFENICKIKDNLKNAIADLIIDINEENEILFMEYYKQNINDFQDNINNFIERQNHYIKTLKGEAEHPICIFKNLNSLNTAKNKYEKIKSYKIGQLEKNSKYDSKEYDDDNLKDIRSEDIYSDNLLSNSGIIDKNKKGKSQILNENQPYVRFQSPIRSEKYEDDMSSHNTTKNLLQSLEQKRKKYIF